MINISNLSKYFFKIQYQPNSIKEQLQKKMKSDKSFAQPKKNEIK